MHGLHHQRVGDDHAAVAHQAAQQAAQQRGAERGGALGVELRVDDVRCHQRRCVGRQRAKGPQFQRFQLRQRLVHHRQRVVRVLVRVAVAGKVLDAAGHAFGLRALQPGQRQPRHAVGVGAEAAFGDHRVGGVAVDVEHGREVPVQAQVAQAAGHGGAHAARQHGVVHSAQRHRTRRLRQAGGAHHRAAFLVHRDQCLRAQRTAQVGHQRADLVLGAQVLAEQAHRADLVLLQEGGGVAVERAAGDVHHEQPPRRHEGAGVAHCVRVTLCRWRGRSGSSPRARASASTMG